MNLEFTLVMLSILQLFVFIFLTFSNLINEFFLLGSGIITICGAVYFIYRMDHPSPFKIKNKKP